MKSLYAGHFLALALAIAVTGCASTPKPSPSTADHIFDGTKVIESDAVENPLKLAQHSTIDPLDSSDELLETSPFTKSNEVDDDAPQSSNFETLSFDLPDNFVQMKSHSVGNEILGRTHSGAYANGRNNWDGSKTETANAQPKQESIDAIPSSFARIKSAETNLTESVVYDSEKKSTHLSVNEPAKLNPLEEKPKSLARNTSVPMAAAAIDKESPALLEQARQEKSEQSVRPKNLVEAIRYRGMLRSKNGGLVAQLNVDQLGMITVRKDDELAVTDPVTGKLEILTVQRIDDGAVWLQFGERIFPVK